MAEDKNGGAPAPTKKPEDLSANPAELTQKELLAAYKAEVAAHAETKEELATALGVVDELNADLEAADAKAGTETGTFIEHKDQKIHVRIPQFKVKGKVYKIADLRDNVELTVADKKDAKKNRQVGLVDYLLEVKSPVLEIEE